MELALGFLKNEPIFAFAVLLAVILVVPIFFERLQLPGLIGLLAAGVAFGPNGLQLLQPESETMKLLSDIGVVYLMFVAGLEMDMTEFQKVKNRSIGFGSLTFVLPLITGTIIARFFGFSWNASLLIGSLLSSHTPLGYPILSRLGLMGNEAVMVTIGGTIFTNIPALLVLAVCVSVHAGSFSLVNLAIMLVLLTLYTGIVLFGFDWAGREFFRRSGDEEGNQFLFVLLAVFLAAVGAQIIGVEKIVGAFLAGMAVNGAMGSGPVKEKVVFVGSVLFIPIFMVNLGLLIDLPAFIETLTSFWLTLAIILGLLGSKLIAALLTQLLYRYTRTETLAIWSLSIPQVAATLAATIVGYNTLNPLGERLLSEEVLNTVIVMMLVTATLGPFLTARAAAGLTPPTTNFEAVKTPFDEENQPNGPFTVIVPVYNPETEKNLVEMAALLVRQEEGRIVPLSIARVMAQMEASAVDAALIRSEKLVAAAVQLAQEFGVKAEPAVRIDDDIAQGIAHASREQKASLIVMGWGETTTLRARLFGNVIDRLLWTAHCPVAVTRLRGSPLQMKRILVSVDNLVARAVFSVRFAYSLAQMNGGQVTLFHVCDRRTPEEVNARIQAQLSALITELAPSNPTQIQIVIAPNDDIPGAILNEAIGYDLVILQAIRRRTMSGLEMDDVTTTVIQELSCSLVMLGSSSLD